MHFKETTIVYHPPIQSIKWQHYNVEGVSSYLVLSVSKCLISSAYAKTLYAMTEKASLEDKQETKYLKKGKKQHEQKLN